VTRRRCLRPGRGHLAAHLGVGGTGNVGGADRPLGGRAGHSVVLSSADRAEAEQVAAATGATLAASYREAVEAADIAILAVPADVYGDVATGARRGTSRQDGHRCREPTTPDAQRVGCTSHAEDLQEAVREARVVKALNTVFAARQADPLIEG
jgi:predicted dinucleotide-binding enzyme